MATAKSVMQPCGRLSTNLPALRVQIEGLLVRLGITRNGYVDQFP